jgi:hypothetical protein
MLSQVVANGFEVQHPPDHRSVFGYLLDRRGLVELAQQTHATTLPIRVLLGL